ncbi:Transcriptional regulator ClgR [Microbacterium sp. 8M]|jgi:transcriptional regulator with XRE-family HTH domain|uniref:helix-turn-helix domain-containing protein n=1 Tax=Microbacterium sp. 8M TaxID=2653153 RepID=UPI0012F2F768|nr:helix-turn-helix transcriptional regulator [Microbacterium sp. 8M]VXB02786.1 Transcriptional regulator ClgR [Microbacterium sp. 8M]
MTATPEIPRIDRTAQDDRPHRATEPERLWRSVVGELLRDARADRGETLAETAQRAGVSPQYLSEMERGLKEPSSEMLAAVSGALELTLLDLTLGVAERISAGASVPARAAAQPVRAAYALAA